jgi:hypothetical protein
MKNAIVSRVLAAALVLFPVAAYCGNAVRVDVLYMNHGPLLSTLEEIKAVVARFGPRVAVTWHDSETDEGQKFMARKHLAGHIPLVIWMNDEIEHRVNGKEVAFTGFPTGSGPAFFQGKWTVDDLKRVLERLTAKNR